MSRGLASFGCGRKHRQRKSLILKRRSAVWAVFFFLVLGCGATLAQDAPDKASGSSEEMIYRPGQGGVTIPKAIYQPAPEYSDKARRKKIQGVVMVEVVVKADGTVRDVSVVKGLEPSLDKQAIAGVSKWKFQPATKDGNPVAVRLAVEVDFHLY
jgi:TonB family protein